MVNRLILNLVILCLLLVSDATFAQAKWSSLEPESIPLNVRQEEFNKGNLIRNPSFEMARLNQSGSLNSGFKLDNWEVVGRNVRLTDKKQDPEGVSEGNHAIRIEREYKDIKEVGDKPEGILSDFIEVIPANYDFYLDIRLEDIVPTDYLDRLQKRVEKSIDIRLKFYDENRKEISPDSYYEYIGKDVDNSFKGFAFSNFFVIDKFDWGRVKAQTGTYPFSEGDLPDGCRYVRIFIGLGCSGKMWVDNVDFRLSKWSFTPEERLDSFFNKKYDLTDLIIPTPKVVENKSNLNLKNKQIDLVFDGDLTPELESSFRILQDNFKKVTRKSVKIVSDIPSRPGKNIQLIFVRNSDNSAEGLKNEFRQITGKKQGYFIKRIDNTVYLGANNPVGFFYGASTLCQLIDSVKAEWQLADITDFPDFISRPSLLINYQNQWTMEQSGNLSKEQLAENLEKREIALQKQIKDVDFYTFYKINQLYSLYFSLSTRWWEPGDFLNKLFAGVGQAASKYGGAMKTAVQINPYFHFKMEQRLDVLNDSLRSIFSHVSDESFERVTNVLKDALDNGAKTVMVCADDYIPHSGIIRGEYALFNREDSLRFVNLADAQSYFLNRLKKWLDDNYTGIRLEFVPAQYNNKFIDYGMGTAETYFRDLASHLDASIPLVWTGNTIRSLSYDMADLKRIKDVYRKTPMVWDNTQYARTVESKNGGYPMNYPSKSVLCNLFEPYDIQYPKDFYKYVDAHYYNNNTGSGEINKIKYLTFSDFSWNSNQYNADFSLYKALIKFVGPQGAEKLLRFNKLYFDLVADWGQLRINLEHDSLYQVSEASKAQTNEKIKLLRQGYTDLNSINDKDLLTELKNVMDNKIAAWEKLVNKNNAQ